MTMLEAEPRANLNETSAGCGSDLAEGCRRWRRPNSARRSTCARRCVQANHVECIGRLAAELEDHPLTDPDVLEDTEVDIAVPRGTQIVTRRITVSTAR